MRAGTPAITTIVDILGPRHSTCILYVYLGKQFSTLPNIIIDAGLPVMFHLVTVCDPDLYKNIEA